MDAFCRLKTAPTNLLTVLSCSSIILENVYSPQDLPSTGYRDSLWPMQLRISSPEKTISIAVLVCCACVACGGPAATAFSGGRTRAIFEADRPFDDAPLSEADFVGNDQLNHRSPSSPPAPQTSEALPPLSSRPVLGYRVQVHSFRDRNTAEAAMSQLRRRFNMGDVRLHIDHEPPYHKVRVGDFRSKENAARILKKIQSRKEYRDAWIVDTMVNP